MEGMVITNGGQIGLLDAYVPRLIDVLIPVPSTRAIAAVDGLAEKAQSASWITRWRSSSFDPAVTVSALGLEQGRLSAELQPALDRLRAVLDPAARQEPA
jgi:hypothetical protein